MSYDTLSVAKKQHHRQWLAEEEVILKQADDQIVKLKWVARQKDVDRGADTVTRAYLSLEDAKGHSYNPTVYVDLGEVLKLKNIALSFLVGSGSQADAKIKLPEWLCGPPFEAICQRIHGALRKHERAVKHDSLKSRKVRRRSRFDGIKRSKLMKETLYVRLRQQNQSPRNHLRTHPKYCPRRVRIHLF